MNAAGEAWLEATVVAGAVALSMAALTRAARAAEQPGRKGEGNPAASAGRHWLGLASAALTALCLLQTVRQGWSWQYLPVYALAAVAAGLAWRTPASRSGAWAVRLGVAGLACAALAAWSLLPVPRLPAPQGPYPVGTAIYRWVDPVREEIATADPDDRRNLIVQAWYPAAPGPGPGARYLDGLGRLPAQVSAIPSLVMHRYDRIDTHARLEAAVHPARTHWPVLLFSPGYGASRSFYTGLLADLASRGWVVLAIDHPYETAVVELADGRLATPAPATLAGDADGRRYMARQLEVRVQDLRSVIDRLDRLDRPGAPRLSAHLDHRRIAAFGHSFGGASAVAGALTDTRIRAVANLDGTLYGRADPGSDQWRGPGLEVPFLLLESDPRQTRHSQHYRQGNQALIERLRAQGYRYRVQGSNHYSLTDVPLFLSAPARWAAAWAIGGERGAAETQADSADVLTVFLTQSLQAGPAALATVAARHPGLVGGAVGPHRQARASASAAHQGGQPSPAGRAHPVVVPNTSAPTSAIGR